MLKIRTQVSQFFNAKNILHGPNSLIALKGLQAVKVAIVITKSISIDKDKMQYLKKNINCHELIIIVRSWDSEPEIKAMAQSLDEIRKFQPDCIVAVGGGSVIDGAKILWSFYEHPHLKENLSIDFMKVPKLRGKAKFIAIPTTIGTGSEVSSSAILYDGSTGSKIPIITSDYLPDIVVLDPKLVCGLPKNIIISTILDACTHSIEGYVSKINNPLVDHFALLSLKIIVDCNYKVIEQPTNEKIISDLQYAAMMAGWVQNHCLVGVSHAIAHQMGKYKISHGIANSIFLPESIIFNSKDESTLRKYENISNYCGIKGGLNGLISYFRDFASQSSFSLSISSYGVGENDYESIAKLAVNDISAKYNPLPFNKKNIVNILSHTK